MKQLMTTLKLLSGLVFLAIILISCSGGKGVAERDSEEFSQKVDEALGEITRDIEDQPKVAIPTVTIVPSPVPTPGVVATPTPPPLGVRKGQLAPDFTLDGFQLVSLGGGGEEPTYKELREVALYDYRGKLVLLNFWATWCPYCKIERPQLEKLHRNEEYQERGFVILSVENSLVGEEEVKSYIKEYELTFPTLLDTAGVSRLYRVTGIPTTLIIGPDGVIERRLDGLPTSKYWESLEVKALIERHLPEKEGEE